MYLAKQQKYKIVSYQIRQSYSDESGYFTHRTLFDLGDNPLDYIEIYEPHIVLFDSALLKALTPFYGKDPEPLLEQLLWDFLPHETKHRLSLFPNRISSLKTGPLTTLERERIDREIHLFDRRRLYYLRYGAVEQSRLSRLHEKCCKPLLSQSRDEREFYFAKEEMALEPGMYLQYVYAIFNLQKHFTQSFAPWLPEAIGKQEMEEHLIVAICALNRDKKFWQSENLSSSLHPHLVRYLLMFFDFLPAKKTWFDDFSKAFMAGHRKFHWPEKTVQSSPETISELFETDFDEVQAMSKERLGKLYRKKAMQLHPDKGGDHDRFIELTDIYNQLLSAKKK